MSKTLDKQYNRKYFHLSPDFLDRYANFCEGVLRPLIFRHVERSIGSDGEHKKIRVLDFGCAEGYLVRALNEAEYIDAVGVDISLAAIEKTVCLGKTAVLKRDKKGRLIIPYPRALWSHRYECVVSIYTLEHMSTDDLITLGKFVKEWTDVFIFKVPVIGPGMRTPTFRSNDSDKTHVQYHDIAWWVNFFEDATDDTLTCKQVFYQRADETVGATFVFDTLVGDKGSVNELFYDKTFVK